jgi:hypothetical protein
MTRPSKILSTTLVAGLLAASYCAWMAAQTADMRFLACHGEYAVGHAMAECRAPALYGLGTWAGLASIVVSAGVVIVRARRRPRP